MEQNEPRNVYIIPSNYTDAGKWAWGLLEPRNCVEAVVLLILISFAFLAIPISIYIRITLISVIAIPIFVFACIGFNGDSLTQFLGHLFKHYRTRKKMSLRRVGQSDGKN